MTTPVVALLMPIYNYDSFKISTLVHDARNALVGDLYREKVAFTHVLFCDSDMVPAPHALHILLQRNVDIIGAAYTTRWAHALSIHLYNLDPASGFLQTVNIDKRGIHKVDGIGAGFMLISRKALDVVAEYSLRHQYSIDNLGMSTAVAQKLEAVSRDLFAKTGYARWFDFLINPKTGLDYGEDTSFCVKAKACGFQVHADSTIDVGHVGQFTFGLQH